MTAQVPQKATSYKHVGFGDYDLALTREPAGTSVAALLTEDQADSYAKLLPADVVLDAAECIIVPGEPCRHVNPTETTGGLVNKSTL